MSRLLGSRDIMGNLQTRSERLKFPTATILITLATQALRLVSWAGVIVDRETVNSQAAQT